MYQSSTRSQVGLRTKVSSLGFANTDQLRSWIYKDEWLVQMERRGFRLAVFDIDNDHVVVGNTQAIFQRDRAKDVAFFGPASYFDIDINEYEDEDE